MKAEKDTVVRGAPAAVTSEQKLARLLYPSIGKQPDGKKLEPFTASISPAVASNWGKGIPPEVSQVFWHEPPASNVVDYAAALHLGGRRFERPDEFEQAKKAMLSLGFGTTMARAAIALVKRNAKHPTQHTAETARAEIARQWGEHTDRNLSEVKALVTAAKKHYPGIGKWLSESRLGNDPDFVQFLHQVTRRNKERGRG